MPKYMVLLGGGEEQWSKFTPEQNEQMLQQYYAWAGRLAAQPWLRGGDQLQPGGRMLRGNSGGTVTDGPYTETKDVISGYVVLEAPDYDAAVAMSKDIPALQHGGYVIVRQIIDMQPDAQLAAQWDEAAKR